MKPLQEKYGRLSVVKELEGGRFPNGTSFRLVEVVCECGAVKVLKLHHLRSGKTVSCGCHKAGLKTTHGMYGTEIHKIWRSMIGRCRPGTPSAKYYFDRGISVCERWLDVRNFALDMGNRPSPDHELDRIDNDKGYSPDNCRWATRSTQLINKRTLKKRSYDLPRNVYPRNGKYFARVADAYLGLFNTPEDAKNAVDKYLQDCGLR